MSSSSPVQTDVVPPELERGERATRRGGEATMAVSDSTGSDHVIPSMVDIVANKRMERIRAILLNFL